jgi:hypothetical protein
MRIRILSALCVLLPVMYSPQQTVAQSNPASLPLPQAFSQKALWAASSPEFPKTAESEMLLFRADLANGPTNSFPGDAFGNDQKDGIGAFAVHAPVTPGQCAHIVLYPAPAMDSKIVVGTAPGMYPRAIATA